MFLLDCVWKATALVAAAGLAGLCLRRAAAAVRHLVWMSALAGVLALPLVTPLVPRRTVPIDAPAAVLLRVNAAVPALARAAVQPAAVPGNKAPAPRRSVPIAGLWAAGVLVVSLQILLGWALALRRRRGARPA